MVRIDRLRLSEKDSRKVIKGEHFGSNRARFTEKLSVQRHPPLAYGHPGPSSQ